MIILTVVIVDGRSIHRFIERKDLPTIEARWQGSTKKYSRIDSHYRQHPIFDSFDKVYFYNHLIPSGFVSFYNHENKERKFVSGHTLSEYIEELLIEIKNKKRIFKNFTVLQNKNFNRKKRCGLLVLKFKDYPFVLKLFMEQPKTFVDPHCKGFEPIFFFYMSGGANRHIAGFTRIKNREYIIEWSLKNHFWKNRIKIPRKWFWLPKKASWIEIKGTNINNTKNVHTVIPGTYAIIADYVDIHEDESDSYERNSIIMNLCNDLNMFIDPHMNNFVIKQNKRTGLPSVTIIDTEHFPTMVGLKEKTYFNDHLDWIIYLARKCLEDIFFRSKNDRL